MVKMAKNNNSGHEPHDTRRSVIAVVDDDQRILESLEILLESADYGVRVFSSATALLDGCSKGIDCVISDIGMPGMDGFELYGCSGSPARVASHPGHRSSRPAESFVAHRPGHYRLFKKPFDGQDSHRGRERCAADRLEAFHLSTPHHAESRRHRGLAFESGRAIIARLSAWPSLRAR